MEVGGLSSEVAALTETVVMSVLEAVVAETLLVAQRSAACLFIVTGCLLRNNGALPDLSGVEQRFPFEELHKKNEAEFLLVFLDSTHAVDYYRFCLEGDDALGGFRVLVEAEAENGALRAELPRRAVEEGVALVVGLDVKRSEQREELSVRIGIRQSELHFNLHLYAMQ
nr:prostatic spermine-binding protein-like [Ipomoea batatas]